LLVDFEGADFDPPEEPEEDFEPLDEPLDFDPPELVWPPDEPPEDPLKSRVCGAEISAAQACWPELEQATVKPVTIKATAPIAMKRFNQGYFIG
jgi:hypothetical protein